LIDIVFTSHLFLREMMAIAAGQFKRVRLKSKNVRRPKRIRLLL
jgi:hypothetical protein